MMYPNLKSNICWSTIQKLTILDILTHFLRSLQQWRVTIEVQIKVIVSMFVVSAVHFAPYLTGLSSMMLI